MKWHVLNEVLNEKCDMNCFQCKLNDCKCNGKMSEWEKEQYRRAHSETYDMSKEDRKKLYEERQNAKRRKGII